MNTKKWMLGLTLALAPAAALAHPYSPGYPAGHYEERTVNQWVPGGYQPVWVPGACRFEGWRNVCWPGHYTQQWMPGHYAAVTQQVWVPAPEWHRWHHERWDHDGWRDRD